MIRLLSLLIVGAATLVTHAELLCFGATWCQPCQQMKPTLARLQREGYPIRMVDVDQRPDLAKRFRVSTVPCFIRVDETGQPMGRLERATTYETLRQMLAQKMPPKAVDLVTQPESPARGERPLVQTAATSRSSRHVEPTATSTPSNQTGPERAAMAASVRLRVEDATGHSFGTGTVIDVHDREALVLTCGHIFRESQGKGVINIDRFDRPSASAVQGSLISYDLELDVALVSMPLQYPIQPAKLADPQSPPGPRSAVFSIGCDHGQPPSVVRGQVNQINKYLGAANITASGRPVDGRSGGGLFRADGRLIGVCNAADPELDEGLYAALPRVSQVLDRNGLSFVYQAKSEETPAAPLTNSNPPEVAQASLRRDEAVRPASFESSVATPPASRPATPPHSTVDGHGVAEELVCVVRTEQGNKTFVIENPSRVLLEYLERENRAK